jgi:hypothetical protein
MKLTCLFDSVCSPFIPPFCWTNIFRDFVLDGTSIHDGMIKANDFRSSIRRHGTSNRKFSHSNRFILQKNSPACRTDAVLRKYGDTSARCTRLGSYFGNGNSTPILYWTWPDRQLLPRTPGQPGLLKPLGFTGGGEGYINSKYDRYIKG